MHLSLRVKLLMIVGAIALSQAIVIALDVRLAQRQSGNLEELEQRALPGLRQHLVTQHFITPRSFQQDLSAYQGSAFSVAPRLTQSAWFRPHNQDPKIPGLYIVGAGTHPGAGLPGVINSAKATVGLINGRPVVESAA